MLIGIGVLGFQVSDPPSHFISNQKPALHKPSHHTPDPSRFLRRLNELRQSLTDKDPLDLADRTGASFSASNSGEGQFRLPYWGREIIITFPGYQAFSAQTGEEISNLQQAMILYYFSTADGTSLSGEWISFASLPNGRFYDHAFQGYTGHELARAFQNDCASFERVAERLGGIRQTMGNASYAFFALPRVKLLVVHWLGDEDFPPSFKILFDSNASHYLPTDGYAILGSTLTRRLIAAKGEEAKSWWIHSL